MIQSVPTPISKEEIEKYLVDNNVQILDFKTAINDFGLYIQTLIISKNGKKYKIDTENQKELLLNELLTELLNYEN